jgi:regulator of replication initiation timing
MDIYKKALKIWGKEPQMLQVIEEMSELTKEILKNINRNKDNIAEIIEETADVEIMLNQLKECYGIYEQVEKYKSEKLLKIEQRLNDFIKNTGVTNE